MIAHVSPATHAYNETLQVLQLASRIQRLRTRRKTSSKVLVSLTATVLTTTQPLHLCSASSLHSLVLCCHSYSAAHLYQRRYVYLIVPFDMSHSSLQSGP